MSLGRYESEGPRRSPVWRAIRLVFALAVLTGVSLFAFQLGVEDERSRSGRLADEAARLTETNQALTQANAQLRAQAQQVDARRRELEAALGGAPRLSDGAKMLLPILEKKLGDGLDAKRVAEMLATLDKPLDCEAPESKRFLVRTPLTSEGPNTSVGFAGGQVTVTGQGVAAKSAEGRVEAWFDAAEPMTVRFTQIGGRTAEAAGKLPLHHTLPVGGGGEHRFSVMAASRGFVQVTSERCKPH
jgi:hypothetical protein